MLLSPIIKILEYCNVRQMDRRGLTKGDNQPWAILRDMFAARLSQLTIPRLSQHAMRDLRCGS
jgi:hypothetical protein